MLHMKLLPLISRIHCGCLCYWVTLLVLLGYIAWSTRTSSSVLPSSVPLFSRQSLYQGLDSLSDCLCALVAFLNRDGPSWWLWCLRRCSLPCPRKSRPDVCQGYHDDIRLKCYLNDAPEVLEKPPFTKNCQLPWLWSYHNKFAKRCLFPSNTKYIPGPHRLETFCCIQWVFVCIVCSSPLCL